MSNEVYQIINAPISAFCFNAKRDQVAVCPNTNEVQIYEKAGPEWKVVHVLKGVSRFYFKRRVNWAVA
jgi:actin related protein 2/3 complex subunit 1A/1B